ncbi:hypothetical protein L3139_26075, partial [[Brevibacterium] frigoritolerans]|uniref:hypothetical protein n=1 Tax=Peribacillus frigoritolerans TaxID=450367 RepID=UPI001F1DB58B
RDSCGNTRPRETPQAQSAEEAPRTARGKRVPGEEINGQILNLKQLLTPNIFLEFFYRLSSLKLKPNSNLRTKYKTLRTDIKSKEIILGAI